MRNEQDVKKIEELLERMATAWDHADTELYGSCFTEEADYITFQGHHLQGKKLIVEIHDKLWSGFLKGSSLVGETKKLTFLTPDVAVTHGLGAVKLQGQETAPKERDSINTCVIVKENDEWKIAAFQNGRIQKQES